MTLGSTQLVFGSKEFLIKRVNIQSQQKQLLLQCQKTLKTILYSALKTLLNRTIEKQIALRCFKSSIQEFTTLQKGKFTITEYS